VERRPCLDPAADPLSVVRSLDGIAVQTERLILRSWRDEDVGPFIRHTNTDSVMRWLGGVQSDAAMREMLVVFRQWDEERGFTFWAVERRADGALLGFCGLKLANTPGTRIEGMYEAGWRLREDAWGQGYAREAAVASLRFAFERLGADRAVAITFPGNKASWGLMERIGMTRRPGYDYVDPRFPDWPTIVYDVAAAELKP
jgi:RimJ/RimL family protein N-acetyltransferase